MVHPGLDRTTGSGFALDPVHELLPMVRRAVGLEPRTLIRLRRSDSILTGFVQLPFGVLVGRSIRLPSPGTALDQTVGAEDLLTWAGAPDQPQPAAPVDSATAASGTFPSRRDAEWRGSLPPASGWQRVDTVPGTVLRGLVAAGVRALADAAAREGLPSAQPRAEVTDALLDATVLTVSAQDAPTVGVTLRAVSAALRMGFLPTGSSVGVDISGRWSRLCAPFGNVYTERGPIGLL